MADPKRTLRRASVLTVAVLVGLGLLAGRMVFIRISNAKTLEAQVAERNKSYVRVTQPSSTPEAQKVVLPGTLQGYVQAPIAARASGYLKKWYRDIGSRVKQGELLAEIETPEIDQQLSQAIAARQQAASSLALASSTLERWEALKKRDAVSQQELEEKRSADAQAKANLAAADANVERLRQTKGFNRVVAPFAGVITKRNVDVGDLIDAGGGAGRALFVMAQTDPLRVYVNVPQSYAHLVKPGQEVIVTQQELRGQSFKGEIVRTAGAIDAQTRTMQVEVMLANKAGKLLPGAYVQVALPLAGTGALTVPTNVLLFRGEGPRVAVVGPDGKVQLRAVKLGRNFGQVIELLDGAGPNDKLVLNPADSLNDGDAVVISQK
ncbi:MAG TPA: efflux RND transporter periplasmic adaptor subunit [Burkholderiales bacterium]|nr:efflux RND transporter periplasmic adaptor subunit [Burkholderiales bacterium]